MNNFLSSKVVPCVVCLGMFSPLLVSEASAADHGAHEHVLAIDQEPNHHLILTSDSIRVFEAKLPPKAASFWHLHEKDSVLLCLDGANVPSEELGKEFVQRPPIVSGMIYYKPYAKNPFIHRIRNMSETAFRMLDIEILKSPTPAISLAPASKFLTIVIDNERVRVSKIELKVGESTDNIDFQGPHLLISMSDGNFAIKSQNQNEINVNAPRGHLIMEENKRLSSIQNSGDNVIELVMVEVK